MQKFKPEKIAKEPIAFKKDKTPPPEDDEEDAATNEKGDDEKILELLEVLGSFTAYKQNFSRS